MQEFEKNYKQLVKNNINKTILKLKQELQDTHREIRDSISTAHIYFLACKIKGLTEDIIKLKKEVEQEKKETTNDQPINA